MIKRTYCHTAFLICTIFATATLAVLSANFLFVNINAQSAGTNPNSAQVSKDLSSVQNLIIPDARGGFSSLQTDADNKVWITTGKWNLVSDPSKIGQKNSSSVGFNATIDMRGTDNLNGHEHKVSDFKLAQGSISSTTQGSIFTFIGKGTVKTPQGTYPQVPIIIKLIDKNPISVAVDNQSQKLMPQWVPGGGTIILTLDQSARDHFGSTPVYGNVREQK
jgi:hypothetical protein